MRQFASRLWKLLGSQGRQKCRTSNRFRPRIDALEDRRLMAVFLVDDDFAGDDPAAFRYDSIQDAVNAATAPVGNRPGDIIVVLPGLYNESVVVDKRLTLLGAFAPSLPYIGQNPNPNDPALNPARASIVDPATGAGFTLTANDIIVQGFTVANFDESIDTQGFSVGGTTTGNKIMRNVVVDNTMGVNLDTSDADNNNGASRQTWIYGNTFRDNNTEGAAAGNGIYADGGVRNVLIAGNRFTGHENASSSSPTRPPP